MIKYKWIEVIAVLLMAAAVLVTGYAYLNPSVFVSITGTAEPKYVSAIDKTEIMSIQIIADETEWANMLENATNEEYIPVTVIINGTQIENVGVRPKGNSSLSSVAKNDETDRFSFKFEFDHYITGQTWLGLDKLAVNNMMGDASYMKEYISYDIMDYAGVESPLYAFADISLNGETWGLYLAVECLEDSYVQRVYGSDHGKLYKPEGMGGRGQGRMNEVIDEMQEIEASVPKVEQRGQRRAQTPVQGQGQAQRPNAQNSPDIQKGRNFGGMGGGKSSDGTSLQYTDDEVSSYASIFDNPVFDTTEGDYKRVIEALKNLSNGADLEKAIDVEAVLKYFAAHTVVVNLDSYVSRMAHNYYLYEDNGQLTILPWDYNLAFGGFQSGSASNVVNFPIDTPVSGVSLADRPLIGKLLEVTEYLELYHEYLRQIVDGYFDSGLFDQTIDSLDALISSYVENDPTAFFDYDAYQAATLELKKLGLLRAESIEGQLDGTIPSTNEGQSADGSSLIDASGVNLSAIGKMGRGGFGNNKSGKMGFKRETVQEAMEIIQPAGENEPMEEQLERLSAPGPADIPLGDFGGMGNRAQGRMGDQFANDAQGDHENAANQNPVFGNRQSVIATRFDKNTWLFIGGCFLLFLGGFVFVILFKRRRNM